MLDLFWSAWSWAISLRECRISQLDLHVMRSRWFSLLKHDQVVVPTSGISISTCSICDGKTFTPEMNEHVVRAPQDALDALVRASRRHTAQRRPW